jgi:FkbM family methyltransferase
MTLAGFEKDWEAIAQAKAPHEAAFWYLDGLELQGSTLAIDIGANSGISALSLHFVQPEWEVLSVEANPALQTLLLKTKEFISRNRGVMDFRIQALGSEEHDELEFYVPVADGRYEEILTMGSFSREALNTSHLIKYIGERFMQGGVWSGEVQVLKLPVVPFDDLIWPTATNYFVKIDVESFEVQVLSGMRKFIEKARPVFLIEIFMYGLEITKMLAEFGYSPYLFDEQTGFLVAQELAGSVAESYNVFYVPTDSPFLTKQPRSISVTRERMKHVAERQLWLDQAQTERGLFYAERKDFYAEREVFNAERTAFYAERAAFDLERKRFSKILRMLNFAGHHFRS